MKLTEVVKKCNLFLRKKADTIFSKFLNMDNDKKERIINAAIKEFARNGYEKASTNEIVKEADISKGLLFHYFTSKKDLYLFLYDYTLDIMIKEFVEKICLKEKDILIRLRQLALIKLELIIKYPEIFNFLKVANYDTAREVRPELENKNREVLKKSYAVMFENIDTSLFRDGIDIKNAINIIIWTLEGIRNQYMEKDKTAASQIQIRYEDLMAEMDTYLELLRKSFYR